MSPTQNHEICPMHDHIEGKLDNIDQKSDRILQKLEDGAVNIATINLRVEILERLTYGAVGIALLAVAGAVVSLVIH